MTTTADRRGGWGAFGAGAAGAVASREAVGDLLALCGLLHEVRGGAGDVAAARVREVLARFPGERLDPVEVLNTIIAEGAAGASDFWRGSCVPTARRLVADLCGAKPDGPPDLAALPPRRFEVELRRTFDLADAPARRLRMPAPLEDAHLTDLEVEVEAGAGDIRIEPGRLEVKPPPSARGRFTLGARFRFTAHAGVPHDDGQPPETWLAQREGPVQVTPAVHALAERLAGGERDPLAQTMAFRDHLIDAMSCGQLHLDALAGQSPTDWVIAHRWYDCRLGSGLLAALCRARGVPARLVGGYLLWDAPAEHYWMEAWIAGQGWTPFDLLAWDLSAAGQDAAWRGVYAGAVDYRMKTQVFPHVFTGAPGVPMGAAWLRLPRAIPGGVEARLVSVPDGRLIYADAVRVVRG